MFAEFLTLFQLFLLCLTSLLLHIGSSNPNVSSPGDYLANEGIGTSFLVFVAPKIGQLHIWASTLYQALYLFFRVFLPAFISIFYPQISTSTDPLPFNSMSMIGYTFMIVGGFGRIWCYRTLGAFFTFELTIRNKHKLIQTGPYAYVRHPSYTFLLVLLWGFLLVHRRLANLFPNQAWIQTLLSPLGILVILFSVILVIARRVIMEEKELATKFGSEWTQYASKRKRFIPKII
ncbi:unnamed protein product [Rotaria magnacalcarata]|uniref:Protein-S-isoprenylcysteine O-methyltransferase n=1 Tax=Rotaria magnacalcarata TaxID=392030 RepID=A0A819ZKY8_9BILA|nr:unnamed protein product [Rotaria magnacalcarata]CAF2144856.1 unnamed protein product [Rotaria magnacalcarata]CAF4115460.1 unnamed protein product [Rotaria magnacalcarata]CAF4169945.1 unnamed protein product [Rotaria magnacalcarata]